MNFFKIRKLRLQREQLRVEISQEKLEEAKCNKLLAQLRLCPHYYLPVGLYREGSRWVCEMAECDEDQEGIIAYGDSPSQACYNFDHLYRGGYILPDPEEEF